MTTNKRKFIDKINCDSCGQEMELVKNFGRKPRGENKLVYRVRRFGCSLCEIEKTVFADGSRDENPLLIKAKTIQEEFTERGKLSNPDLIIYNPEHS